MYWSSKSNLQQLNYLERSSLILNLYNPPIQWRLIFNYSQTFSCLNKNLLKSYKSQHNGVTYGHEFMMGFFDDVFLVKFCKCSKLHGSPILRPRVMASIGYFKIWIFQNLEIRIKFVRFWPIAGNESRKQCQIA